MKLKDSICAAVAILVLGGCAQVPTHSQSPVIDARADEQAENDLFLHQATFDPWILSTTNPSHKVPVYLSNGKQGSLYDSSGSTVFTAYGGHYDKGMIHTSVSVIPGLSLTGGAYSQSLDLKTGILTTNSGSSSKTVRLSSISWPKFWSSSDIVIDGDAEAQQVTHAELFYLCSSLDAGGCSSIPPMGLSSSVYDGHIFWDAEIWMMPALLPQHPDLAKSIVDYRFARLAEAKALATSHGYAGSEYPWESAATGKEEAPDEFSYERHITADVAYAAWQYYLWTGDKTYLRNEAYPILASNANYWDTKAKRGADGHYHIDNVIGPDETAGQVTDDAWTNGVVSVTLKDAISAARKLGTSYSSEWSKVADNLVIPYDSSKQLYLQYPAMSLNHLMAKQADTQMLIYPLDLTMTPQAASNTLDFYLQHTIHFGPAMTSSINATIAARLDRSQQSLDLFRDSYRPFMRGPWDAFSEKRTKNDFYFTTGMGGCLQTVLYGFAGLNIVDDNGTGHGTLVARTGDAALYVAPHLPPGWTKLTVEGVRFRGKSYTITIGPDNKVSVTAG